MKVLRLWILLLPALALLGQPSGHELTKAIRDRIEMHQEQVPFPFTQRSPAPHTSRYDLGESSISSHGSLVIKVHWFTQFAALPFLESDLVVRATVSAAESLISSGGTTIFSLYSLRISEVLRRRSFIESRPGEVQAERRGGSITMPDEALLQYRIDGQGHPRVGGENVLFLRQIDAASSEDRFEILTAYEIYRAQVVPIDEWPKLPNAGRDSEDFLRYLRSVIEGPHP